MTTFNGRIYFLSALYHVQGSFSHLPKFVKIFASYFSSLPYECSFVLEKVRQLREEYMHTDNLISDDDALKLMLAQDLEAVEAVLSNRLIVAEIDKRRNIEYVLNECRDKAVGLLRDIGVQIDVPLIFLVDELPKPYNSRGYSALTIDVGDEEKYGIRPGIYFPKGRLRPFYSEFLLMHELIHVVLGKASPYLLARGLEEGLAEVVGAIYLSSKILSKELTVNIFVYNRLSYDQKQFWELYMDSTRQATMIYQRFGLMGIVALLNMGRDGLKKIENYCFRMQFDQIELPRGDTEPSLSDILDFLSLAFSRNLVVSPTAKYLSYYVRPDRTVLEILTQARMDKTAGKIALKELEERVNLISFSDDLDVTNAVVNWTDCDSLCEGSIIRYEIP